MKISVVCMQIFPCGYGSIPINTIFRGMNIHLPAILMWTTGVQGFDTLPCVFPKPQFSFPGHDFRSILELLGSTDGIRLGGWVVFIWNLMDFFWYSIWNGIWWVYIQWWRISIRNSIFIYGYHMEFWMWWALIWRIWWDMMEIRCFRIWWDNE